MCRYKVSRKLSFCFITFVFFLIGIFHTSGLQADVFFNDGGIYDIDYVITDIVRVENNTTLNILPGGSIDSDMYSINSNINISGGHVHFLEATYGYVNLNTGSANRMNLDRLQAEIHNGYVHRLDITCGVANVANCTLDYIDFQTGYGGKINLYESYVDEVQGYLSADGDIDIYESSIGNMSGTNLYVKMHSGAFEGTIYAGEDFHFKIYDGDVFGDICSGWWSDIEIYGGTIHGGVELSYDGDLDMAGGKIIGKLDIEESRAKISGGEILGGLEMEGFFVNKLCNAKISGWGFQIDGVPVPAGIYDGTDYPEGHLAGFLEDGSPIDWNFTMDNYSGNCYLELIVIPEPCSFSIMLLGGSMIVRARRYKTKSNFQGG